MTTTPFGERLFTGGYVPDPLDKRTHNFEMYFFEIFKKYRSCNNGVISKKYGIITNKNIVQYNFVEFLLLQTQIHKFEIYIPLRI